MTIYILLHPLSTVRLFYKLSLADKRYFHCDNGEERLQKFTSL